MVAVLAALFNRLETGRLVGDDQLWIALGVTWAPLWIVVGLFALSAVGPAVEWLLADPAALETTGEVTGGTIAALAFVGLLFVQLVVFAPVMLLLLPALQGAALGWSVGGMIV